jgi:hypothetical protein
MHLKELTIEQKAKAYDEVIERAKKWRNAPNADKIPTYASRVVDNIFPELSESEDEKIRKAIKMHFEIDSHLSYSGINKKNILDWIEKQANKNEEILILKDQIESLHAAIKAVKETYRIKLEKQGNNMGISEATKQELEDNLNKALEKETPESYNEFLEKRGEQNLDTDFSDLRTWKYIVDAVWTEKEGIGQYLDSPFTEEVAKKLQKRFGNIEQKPAWSEEDERMFDSVVWHLRYSVNVRDIEHSAGQLEDWLKSLKERVQPQKQWEPSDE